MPSLKAQHNGVTDSSSAYIFTHTEQNAQNLQQRQDCKSRFHFLDKSAFSKSFIYASVDCI